MCKYEYLYVYIRISWSPALPLHRLHIKPFTSPLSNTSLSTGAAFQSAQQRPARHTMLRRLFAMAALALARSAAATASTQPPVVLVLATYAPAATPLALFARDQQCPVDTLPCPTSLGAAFKDICCQNGQTCALDANNAPACCPSGAVCTGTAPASAPTGGATAPVSYVENPYFSFPYAPTTFGNSASCAAAGRACSSNYNACVTGLQGSGGYGVTVNVPGGGGTTVGGGTAGNLGASATPLCSSLSSKACARLDATKCSSYGQGSGASRFRHPPATPLVVLIGTFSMVVMSLGPLWP
ncbi:Conserved oligomeric Golgi complex subunit 8 [Purpureocillium lavendulum]|uniref:Conserved oligomeric Golgi complex subunit 8 n=1 Tax=Purpureocillium lavendulum TaxID=1247861 RepID=A0AB34G1J0_9HYPO|nr:Conserved oligomeric Golgi complex subunit 8 [Purpureocillium lavendulum]